MPEAFHAEFTGERVIPGLVEDNLFNEHLARYRLTAHLVASLGLQGAFLDAGCGAGYGTAELANSGARVLGIDVSSEAIAHARANYSAQNLRFEEASCIAIPAEDGAFDLIAAFEVIEHLDDWRAFLEEARRVLKPAGLFLVSTPNRLYYAESRKKSGPNPFHVHEFTEEEFRAELESVFPSVKILLQNHVEGIAFSGADAECAAALQLAGRESDPSNAHFFVAVCSKQTLPPIHRFVYIPETGNVLQTRERHIGLLEGEIGKKNQWIATEKAERERMMAKVRDLEAELEQHNRWARQANQEAERRAQLVAGLQEELRKSNEWAQTRHADALRVEAELRKSNEWARVRDAEAVERGSRIEQLQDELARATSWARERDAEADERGRRVVHLQDELAQASAWARDIEERLQEDLRQSNEWAVARDAEAEERGKRVVELQDELAQATRWALARDAETEQLRQEMASAHEDHARQMTESSAGYESAIEQWRRDKEASDRWAIKTEQRLSGERDAAREAFAAKQAELENASQRMASLQLELEQVRAQFEQATARMDMIAQSRWVRLGRGMRVGPEIERIRP